MRIVTTRSNKLPRTRLFNCFRTFPSRERGFLGCAVAGKKSGRGGGQRRLIIKAVIYVIDAVGVHSGMMDAGRNGRDGDWAVAVGDAVYLRAGGKGAVDTADLALTEWLFNGSRAGARHQRLNLFLEGCGSRMANVSH